MASFSFTAAAPVVFVVVAVVAQLQAAAFAAEGLTVGKEQREFDYFVLSLQWPGTSCRNVSWCCEENGCCRGADTPTEFTIHGLWPQYEIKGGPSCCSDQPFDENEITTLSADLYKSWPSYRCGLATSCNNRKISFWGQQYEKHGTCAFQNEFSYFSIALGLFERYNVTKALEDAGIVPSDTVKYPMQDVFDAIFSAFDVYPKLMCGKKGIVKELYLCFDKELEPRSCGATKSCPKRVRLPKLSPPEELDMIKGEIPSMVDA